MLLALIVFLGGVLTILSPCILPVLPFVFARSDRRFATNGLPLLVGMAITFALVATLAAVGGAWAVSLNRYGRYAALVLLTIFAVTLLSRRLATSLTRPFVAIGNRLASDSREGIAPSLLLGIATGLLWAPCAGPILGLLLTGAALSGPTAHTTLLLLAYAAGAATSLAIAILAGGRVFSALKRSLGAGEWVRRGLGIAVLVAVAAIALGWDGTVLTRLSAASTAHLEDTLLRRASSVSAPAQAAASAAQDSVSLPVEGRLPALDGATAWLNSPPLDAQALRGKVVLVDFWTYSCINCLRALPYVKRWYEAYKDHGLVVIGVHAPEFAFEKDLANVRRAVSDLGILYPVALDDDYAIWRGFDNHYWPAHYFIDATGRIRAHHFGEGDYAESERIIRELLGEAGHRDLPAATTAMTGVPGSAVAIAVGGIEAPADLEHVQSQETYIGYRRAEGFRSPGGFADDRQKNYELPASLSLDQWALAGRWVVTPEKAVLAAAPGKIEFRFAARDLHIVLGPGGTQPVRFRVLLDGAPPGVNHGVDTDAAGNGTIREQRLYQLIRLSAPGAQHTFSIELLDPGAEGYSFTFG